jgi:desulfoferrodoxin (superoxide reductase-like protein)
MYKTIFSFFVFSLLITQPVFAHPPSSIDVQYNKADNAIMVSVTHHISSKPHEKNRTHFIKEISLRLNEQAVDSKTFSYQNNPNFVKANFSMPKHESSDKLEIKAVCSTSAELIKEIAIIALPEYQKTGKAENGSEE